MHRPSHPRKPASPAGLSTKPGSSTTAQRGHLMRQASRGGYTLEQVRDLAGGKLHDLSAAEASRLIQRLGGSELPNPPGQKPSPYKDKRRQPGVIRMITSDHVDQIMRLGFDAFDLSTGRLLAWLRHDFNVDSIEGLATAERAGQVIRVLKQMLKRKDSPNAPSV